MRRKCPYCGEAREKYLEVMKSAAGSFYVACENCFSTGPEAYTYDEAIRLYTERTYDKPRRH